VSTFTSSLGGFTRSRRIWARAFSYTNRSTCAYPTATSHAVSVIEAALFHDRLRARDGHGVAGKRKRPASAHLGGAANESAERGAREGRTDADAAHAQRRQLLDRKGVVAQTGHDVDGFADRRADR